jgi:hypothetical protein
MSEQDFKSSGITHDKGKGGSNISRTRLTEEEADRLLDETINNRRLEQTKPEGMDPGRWSEKKPEGKK